MMRFTHNRLIAFDVDDTLVYLDQPPTQTFDDGVVVDGVRVWKHLKHIEYLKEKFNKGIGIIVWSQTGDEWAEKVIREVGLENFVHFVMTKPEEYVDDLPVSGWMKRKFIEEFKP